MERDFVTRYVRSHTDYQMQEKSGYIWKVARVRVRTNYRPKKKGPAQPEGRSRTGKYLEGA